MKSLFISDSIITQKFGARPEYYSQFGLDGHEGIDLVPVGKSWNIISPVFGEIKNVYESEVYGKTIILWCYDLCISFRFAHMSETYVEEGQFVKDRFSIGKMGNTGKSQGAHLHLNAILCDKFGARLYPNNGYKGRVDPLGILHVLEFI